MNREMLRFFRMKNGTAYLGNINFYGDNRQKVAKGEKSVYQEYTGQLVCNFECSFVVPTADAELQQLIRDWNADDRLPKDPEAVKKITTRVDRLGGIHLIWY